MKRNNFIDMLKGILIILVVLGHAIQNFYPDVYNYRIDFKLIYSFHMFLFILISGFLITYTNKKIDIKWLKKRFIRLMIPYFIWTLIYNVVINHNYTVSSYLLYCIKPSFWYLIVLFLCDCFLLLQKPIEQGIRKINFLKKDINFSVIYYFIISIVLFGIYYVTTDIVQYSEIIKMLAIYIPYYFLGVYLGENYSKFTKYRDDNRRFVFIVLYVISMLLYTYKDETKFMQFFAFTHLPASILKLACTFYNHFVVAILGIITFAIIVDLLKNIKVLNFVKEIGKYTLSIYLVSSICFINICDIAGINIVVSTALGVVIPIILYKIFEKSKILKLCLFGEKSKKE